EVELLDGVGGWRITQEVIRYLVVIHAVEQKIIGLLAVAIDERSTAITASTVAVIKAAGVGRHRPRCKQSQLDVIARGQGKIIVGSGVDDCINLRAFRLQNWH